ncbi:MAG TPA: hypothetical protein VN673_19020, partial [Clostridia bacterium]|nr:hypothetical protein [Clostridia bacterium]
FKSERVVLQGGALTLRQGKAWPPDLGVTVHLHARQGEDLAGKTIQIGPNRPLPVPRVTLRWKDDQQHPVTRVFTNGYALHLAFGQANNARLPGRIYLALPDPEKSVVAGTFEAEIRKPVPAKPKGQKTSPKPLASP